MIENLILGSARWGSRTSVGAALEIIDTFVEAGGREIDSATNYPINANIGDHGLSIAILDKWLKLNPGTSLDIFVKIGSVNNLGGPENDLKKKTLESQVDNLKVKLGSSLGGIGIHWDNRGLSETPEIEETISYMRELSLNGFRIGISGVVSKDLYFSLAPDLSARWEIQVKEFEGNNDIRNSYLSYFPLAKYIAYGIKGRGRLEGQGSSNLVSSTSVNRDVNAQSVAYRQTIKHLLQTAKLDGVIIGPRTIEQLNDVLIVD